MSQQNNAGTYLCAEWRRKGTCELELLPPRGRAWEERAAPGRAYERRVRAHAVVHQANLKIIIIITTQAENC